MELRELGSTGIRVSPIGLGTVKFGRNRQVKYPSPFELPGDDEIEQLLSIAQELGINLIDTAPAYGSSQERLGKLLPGPRDSWVIVSKVGEQFDERGSTFDFSHRAVISTVEESLRTLGTDYLDTVLIHSDGNDLRILEHEGAFDALCELKERGLIRSHGMSSKSCEGGLWVVQHMDVVMATCNLQYSDDLPVLEAAARLNKGVLIKKGLLSGHLAENSSLADSFTHIYSQPGVSSVIIGTINPDHLRRNAALAEIHSQTLSQEKT